MNIRLKIDMLKERHIPDLEVERIEGDKVYVKGGVLDFGELGKCHERTVRETLEEILLKITLLKKVSKDEVIEIILEMITMQGK